MNSSQPCVFQFCVEGYFFCLEVTFLYELYLQDRRKVLYTVACAYIGRPCWGSRSLDIVVFHCLSAFLCTVKLLPKDRLVRQRSCCVFVCFV